MKKIIPLELLEKVANYLASKPWIETNAMLQELTKLPDYEEPKETKQEKK